jgi:hypothetical protein
MILQKYSRQILKIHTTRLENYYTVQSITLEIQHQTGRNTILAHSQSHLCVISGFRREVRIYKIYALLGFYAACTSV